MAAFLDKIFGQLQKAGSNVVVREIRGEQFVGRTGSELLEEVQRARGFLRGTGLVAGDRCGLLGANSIAWAVLDLALMAEGVIVVPLYSRQAPAELAAMLRDSAPRLLLVSDAQLGDRVAEAWPGAPRRALFAEALAGEPAGKEPLPRGDGDLVTIIYTSGTSGEPKGVCLSVANLNHMLGCTAERLDQLMGARKEPDRIFHYLPLNFAASWLLLLSAFSRDSTITLSTDLNKLADEIRLAAPNYFLNVPTLLERVRRGVEDALRERGGLVRRIFTRSQDAWQRKRVGRGSALDRLWLRAGEMLLFRAIRKRFGPNLRALICGSAPLAPETHQFFLMLGIPVLQAYGLTETTGICTLDDPRVPVEPGRVGFAVPGVEMKIGENEEILVSGPNIFAGYWNRPDETTRAMREGWFHTGDQGEVTVRGNWRITGRIKNLIILNSGHNIAPEPIEGAIGQHLPKAEQLVLVGNGRGYLCLLVAGGVERSAVQEALDRVNADLPHYRQVRNFVVASEPFTVENGMLTANGKLRRDAINERYAPQIEAMYGKRATA